jgi:hypothetical protein
MPDYRKMGHAMRRRAGAASSHIDAANKGKTSVEVPSAIAEHIKAGSAKLSVGAVRGTLMPRKNTQAGDPVGNNKANRTFVSSKGGAEKMGAGYKISATYEVTSPEAGQTMRNARIVPSAMGTSDEVRSSIHDSMM